MNKQLLKHALAIAAVLTLGGCATTSGNAGALKTTVVDAPNGIGGAAIGELVNVTPSDDYDASSVIVATEYTAASGRLCRRLVTTDGMSLSRVVCKNDNNGWSWARDLMPASNQSKSQRSNARHSSGSVKSSESAKSSRSVESSQSVKKVEAKKLSGIAEASISEPSVKSNVEDELNLSALEVEAIGDVTDVVEVSDITTLNPGEKIVLPNETLWSFAKRTTGNALNWQRIAEVNDIEDTRTIVNGDVLQVPVELLRDGS